jgi:cytochrome c-type biogenesis protein CcmH/NrfG
MTQLNVSITLGTTATILAIVLISLRAEFNGRRPLETFTQWWIAANARTSVIVTGLLAIIAVFSFGRLAEVAEPPTSIPSPGQILVDGGTGDSSSTMQELASLRAYTNTLDAKTTANAPPAPSAAELSDVDSMIARLAARLEREPDDVKGWKMLGWSYTNMDRPEDAVRAYEKALKLEPSDGAAQQALEQAKAALNAASLASPSEQKTSPPAPINIAADGQRATGHDSMIRSMVYKLATRLDRAPNDEDGWLHLLRSHVTLDERDAAKAALSKAKATFANDAAALGRLSAAARELGVESP